MFLRAVNVGGTGRLPMGELKAACAEAGLGTVATYLATGNLALRSDATPDDLAARLAGILRERFAMERAGVVVRTPEELASLVQRNPYPEAAADRPNHLLLGFLAGSPRPDAVSALAALPAPERRTLDGQHIYIDYADGIGRTKLTTGVLERALGVTVTMRNWTTVTHMLALVRKRQE